MTKRTILATTASALLLAAVATTHLIHARPVHARLDQMTTVIRSEGPNFVLDLYYEGQVRTTKPIMPKDLVPYLTNQVQPGARIIDLTGKVHVVQW